MRFWRSVLLLLLSLSVSLIVCLGGSIKVSATDRTVIYTQIQRDAGIDIFGSQIPYNVVYDGVQSSGYFTLTDWVYTSCGALNVDSNTVLNSPSQADDYVWLFYETTAFNGQYFADFDISMNVDFSDSARGIFGISYTGLVSNHYDNTTDNSISDYPNNYFNNIHAICQNTSVSSSLSDYYGYMRLNFNVNSTADYWYYRPILYDFSGGQQITSIHFEHIRSSSTGQVGFVIGLPYVYGSVSQGSQVTTTAVSGSGSGDINVDVNVDMTETNGILGTISSILSGLVDGIKGLFVPDSAWLSAWYASMVQSLYDAFGDIPQLNTQITQGIQNLINASAIESFQWPGINIPGVGIISPAQTVPLKPHGTEFASFYSFIRVAINIVATIAVINMLISKIKAVIVGEVVVVDGD